MSNHSTKIWTKDFINISLVQFIVFIGFYTLLTTLPIYVMKELGGTEAQGGLVVTIMLIAAIIMRPISGNLIEKVGKKNTLMWGTGLFSGTMFFYLLVDSFIGLMILRFIHGLSFGVLTTVVSAIAADVVPNERKGAGLGYFAMATNIAMVVGPFLGLTLIQFISFKVFLFVVSIIILLSVLCAFQVKVPQITHTIIKNTMRKFSIHDLVETKALPIAAISLFVGVAYSSILSYISVFANTNGLENVASYFFVVFAVVMILARPSLGQLFDVKGPKYVIIPSLIVFSSGLVLLSFTSSPWMFLVAAAVIGLGSGSLLPSFQTMCIQAGGPGRSGHATATFYIFWDIGIATGSYVLGLIVAMFNFQVLYITCAILLLIVLGMFMLQQSWQGKEQKVKEQVPVENV
ncbi:MFS transporter [Ornithinibacillus halotolerans]|uniref:MFS-type transporter YwoG n=1 Tax=Ornithinibacillus halotolerans TaxID=1274357 RepID=A0A916S2W1_9BACI|nr:MFS transporter [Ornithinibacillus halotolerans]GGA81266.1 putative MFS-type transporter YwoG [Ornithinibacillus halotolerans]